MNSNYTFNHMPTVGISRSRFTITHQHKTSFNLGECVPIYVDEVLPGDTRSIDLAALVRMSTPIAPIMDNIHLDLFAFFVPNRLVWDHWKEFMGENKESAGIPSADYSVPGITWNPETTSGVKVGGLLDHLGLPLNLGKRSPDEVFVSALFPRAYFIVCSEWFRNQNVSAPLPVQTGDTDGIFVPGETEDDELQYNLYLASKLPDYFTKALPYAQKGDAVKIPMGNFAPLTTGGSVYSVGDDDAVLKSVDVIVVNDDILDTNLGIDVSAVAGTIDQLRYAFQLQKLLWKDACYGSRYWELLASHFGVTSPDASLQRPEYLGGKRMEINIDQVLSTAGYSNTDATTVGAPGANSVSAFKGSIFTKSFTEHGTLMIIAVARHDQTYCQGVDRMWSRKNRFDYYWPVFANLGSQSILNKELYLADEGEYEGDDVFGYQEAWAEYRFKNSKSTGLLRVTAPNALDYWTLTNKFNAQPVLSEQFIHQDRGNIARALVTGFNGPDFIADFYFRDIAVRPMPTFSLPGFADHH